MTSQPSQSALDAETEAPHIGLGDDHVFRIACACGWSTPLPGGMSALLAEIDRLRSDLGAIYGRMRHTHPDDVSCATAGPKNHPPHFQPPEFPPIGWGHSGPCARPDCNCDANKWALNAGASPSTAEETPEPGAPVGPVRMRSFNCAAGDHNDCLGMVEQDVPELGITDCLCQCHAESPR